MSNTAVAEVNPREFGVDESKALELTNTLGQIKSERDVLVAQFDDVIKMDVENPETVKSAKSLRKLIKDNRTKGIEVWHKTNKEVFLRAGQFIDAVRRKEVSVNSRMEDMLEDIERYAERKEQERIDALRSARLEMVSEVSMFFPTSFDLGYLTDVEFNNMLSGAKLQMEAHLKEMKRIEDERIAKEKAEEEERERIRIENERLRKEAEAKEKQLAHERAKAAKERQALEDKIREREEANRKLAEEKEIQDAIIEGERNARLKFRLKLEKELKEKADAAERIRLERLEAERVEAENQKVLLNKPVKDQLNLWVDGFELPGTSIEHDVTVLIQSKFNDFKKWCVKQVDTI